jgi:hypothetical protein
MCGRRVGNEGLKKWLDESEYAAWGVYIDELSF